MMNKENKSRVGIVGYGAYIPQHYIIADEINKQAGSLGLVKKALADWDEDSVTMAVEAGQIALETAGIRAKELGAVYVGSESPPYAVNPISTIVGDVLGVSSAGSAGSGLGEYRAVDLQFACKAATAGVQMAMGEVAGDQHDYALVIGTDKAQAGPGDPLEWSAGAAAAALVIGKTKLLASVLDSVSITSDTPDFWRRELETYPKHGGRFSGKPAYFAHILKAGRILMERNKLKAKEINFAVAHMPNGRFPIEVLGQLGFEGHQFEKFLTVKEVGNPYSASAMLGMIAILEHLKPGELALVVAYGSGAGADAMLLEGKAEINKRRWGGLGDLMMNRKQVGLQEYRKKERWE